MGLERIRTLFYIAVIALAVILDCTGGIIGWATAIVVLAGARPMFRAITNGTACHIINDAQSHRPHLDNDVRL